MLVVAGLINVLLMGVRRVQAFRAKRKNAAAAQARMAKLAAAGAGGGGDVGTNAAVPPPPGIVVVKAKEGEQPTNEGVGIGGGGPPVEEPLVRPKRVIPIWQVNKKEGLSIYLVLLLLVLLRFLSVVPIGLCLLNGTGVDAMQGRRRGGIKQATQNKKRSTSKPT